MSFAFKCPNCKTRHTVSNQMAGTKAKCKCGALLTVPDPNPALASADPIFVTCRCSSSFKAKPSLAGTRVTCPACGQPLDIPAASPSPVSDPLHQDDFQDALSAAAGTFAYTPPTSPALKTNGYVRQYESPGILQVIWERLSLGIVSFGIAMLVGLTYFILIVSFANTTREEYLANESRAFTVGVITLIMLAASLAGAVIGAVSVQQQARDTVFAYLGVAFNVLIILTFVCCGLLGLVLNA